MPYLVLFGEGATTVLLALFCLMLASDAIRGPVFQIEVNDPVGWFLIRYVQCAFTLGYGALFVQSALVALCQT